MSCRKFEIGQVYSRWTVVGLSRGSNKRTYCDCKCECGTIKTVAATSLGVTSHSCGCYMKEKLSNRAIHGHTKNGARPKGFVIWLNMICRCTKESRPDFKHYGGRGIVVCDRWKSREHGFSNFIHDMGEPPAERPTIDRIDTNKGYSPDNCRWADWKSQQRNKRSNRTLTHNSKTQPVSAWSEETGIPYRTLLGRINLGWTSEQALTTPAVVGNRKKNLFATACAVLLVLSTGLSVAQSPPKPVPADPSIKLPDQAVPAPTPKPNPSGPQTLNSDEIYWCDSKVELFFRQSPPGVLTMTAETGPVKMRAKWVDSGGKTQTRTFAGPFVYFFEAAKSAPVELLIVPKGVAADKEIIQRSIDANNGSKPPPDPPPPKPDDIKSDPIWQSVSAMYGADQSPEKLTMARRLASVYRNAVTPALNWTPTVDDQRLTTFRELSDAMAGAAGAAGVPLPNLQPIREIFRRELLAKVGDGDGSALTLDLRFKAKQQFTRFALILEALGQ